MTTSVTALCPCGSKLKFGDCCQPVLLGKSKAQTAEALLRARYTAFVEQEIDFVVATHHSKTRSGIDRKEIESWAKNSEWHGLEVVQREAGEATDTQGTLIFCAKYSEKTGENAGKIQDHWEKSFFERDPSPKGDWKFLDAQGVHVGTYKRAEPKIGRNDPCPCGSGKKYKKCHEANPAA